jgi:hypothetical protein
MYCNEGTRFRLYKMKFGFAILQYKHNFSIVQNYVSTKFAKKCNKLLRKKNNNSEVNIANHIF